ncbi:YdcF family protein [Enterococcus sp. BWT-B8]|uniref:YdcF family protein n=1 Tax=Enterococcus sp. BWT-B8 TaxID=2885157 RepID=UPI001E4CBCEC|nr:YdcF family protein [Enterococcus sp. BWT-B8]MCB5950467.1 YdcF family protein [Enterococcus sp. BWT-B8]
MTHSIDQSINCLGTFCGKQDIEHLTKEALNDTYGIKKVDVMVLFGGSILAGVEVMVDAIQNQIAQQYIIVGGYGHTSETLFTKAENAFPGISTGIESEAELFSAILSAEYRLAPDYLETKSTNCGNNVTYLLDLIHREQIPAKSILIIQDAAMQLRMDLTLKKHVSKDVTVINYPAYHAEIILRNNGLAYREDIKGMWEIKRYISLLLGEIPRIRDDEHGYGPKGRNFLTHIDIPVNVMHAFDEVSTHYPELIRKANPKFASQ